MKQINLEFSNDEILAAWYTLKEYWQDQTPPVEFIIIEKYVAKCLKEVE